MSTLSLEKTILKPLMRFFNTENSFSRAYKRFFSINEVENDIALQWFAGAILVGYLLRFNDWMNDFENTAEAVKMNLYKCWPFFQSCGEWHVLSMQPYGYSQPILFMALFAVMVGAAYAMYARRWAWVHAAIFVLFIARLYFMAINYNYKGNFDYYGVAFSFLFLFIPQKRFFTQLTLVTFYVISTSAKIHESWILGSYFSALKIGLPIFGKGEEFIWTNLVIFMEMIMAWFLFSSNKLLQRSVLTFFIIFHIYSGTLVYYLYPTTVLPTLIIMFGPFFKPYKQVPLHKSSIPGWLFIFTLFFLQSTPKLIPGDEKLTLEGNFYGLYMFEANHQCVSKVEIGENVLQASGNKVARNRCDVYDYLFTLKNKYCFESPIKNEITFTFDHSINGSPFYRIVDHEKLCTLTYNPFGKNSWIKDEKTAKPVARALENPYM